MLILLFFRYMFLPLLWLLFSLIYDEHHTSEHFLNSAPCGDRSGVLRKDVRPDESQRKAPAVCVYSRFSRSSGRGGVTVVARCLKAALRDALGKASTGQGLDLDTQMVTQN
jgi:hypothetical protein